MQCDDDKLFTLIKKNGAQFADLRFVSFDPKTCCAIFETFTRSSRQIWDCEKLAGIKIQNVPPIPPQPPVDCTCNGTIMAGGGTPETFNNNNVTFIVPQGDSRTVNGRVNICKSCDIDESVFEFLVPPVMGSMFGFRFESSIIESVMCADDESMLTAVGMGVAEPVGNNGLDGIFQYELILITGTGGGDPGSLQITLRDSNGIVFHTAAFAPTVGQDGKFVSITECPS